MFLCVSVDVVSVRHITAALHSQQEVMLNRQEVTRALNRMFHSVSQEVSGHVTSEETSSLMFRLNDPSVYILLLYIIFMNVYIYYMIFIINVYVFCLFMFQEQLWFDISCFSSDVSDRSVS